ncbi:MAG: hypothetical protein P4L84_22420 [Isosphaeraceae bacterium]|nr:hypothetical protein [Isosphaeraceae bacterium]
MPKSLRVERTGWSRILANGLVSLSFLIMASFVGCGGGEAAPANNEPPAKSAAPAVNPTAVTGKSKVDTTSRRQKQRQQAASQ